MRNEKGSSLPETLLTVVIVLLIFGTLLPTTFSMEQKLHDKKMALHATETAYTAIGKIERFHQDEGVQTIDGEAYHWQGDNHQICVQYKNLKGPQEKCISTG